MKILYAGSLLGGSSSLFRLWALERLGHTVVAIDSDAYAIANPLLSKIALRLATGPHGDRLNRDILRLAEAERPDIFWADKLLLLKPATLKRLRELNLLTVSYMIDNAFGPRRDPGWRLYMQDIPFFDLHVTQRDVSMAHYREQGARDVMKVQTAYEPTVHYPAPRPIADADRDRQVSFIGTPYDDRATILSRLSEAGVPVIVSGNERSWRRALSPAAYAAIFRFGELYGQQYREAIWHSKINLSFLTKSNQDEYTHKSFEIAACGGFLMAERSQGHESRFREGEEAVFFDSYEDLLARIERYLPDAAARDRIAAAGQRRAQADGYHNDRQVERIVERLQQIRVAQDASEPVTAKGRR